MGTSAHLAYRFLPQWSEMFEVGSRTAFSAVVAVAGALLVAGAAVLGKGFGSVDSAFVPKKRLAV